MASLKATQSLPALRSRVLPPITVPTDESMHQPRDELASARGSPLLRCSPTKFRAHLGSLAGSLAVARGFSSLSPTSRSVSKLAYPFRAEHGSPDRSFASSPTSRFGSRFAHDYRRLALERSSSGSPKRQPPQTGQLEMLAVPCRSSGRTEWRDCTVRLCDGRLRFSDGAVRTPDLAMVSVCDRELTLELMLKTGRRFAGKRAQSAGYLTQGKPMRFRAADHSELLGWIEALKLEGVEVGPESAVHAVEASVRAAAAVRAAQQAAVQAAMRAEVMQKAWRRRRERKEHQATRRLPAFAVPYRTTGAPPAERKTRPLSSTGT